MDMGNHLCYQPSRRVYQLASNYISGFNMSLPRVLILAESCNPEWPSLPIVGYKYARALSQVADVTLVTHPRNREAIDKAGDFKAPITYIDNEWVAAPMHRFA